MSPVEAHPSQTKSGYGGGAELCGRDGEGAEDEGRTLPIVECRSVENTSTECSSAVAHLLRYAHLLGNSNTVLRDTYSVLSRVGRRAACSARAERPTCSIGVM
jgi:hypothetical protein